MVTVQFNSHDDKCDDVSIVAVADGDVGVVAGGGGRRYWLQRQGIAGVDGWVSVGLHQQGIRAESLLLCG